MVLKQIIGAIDLILSPLATFPPFVSIFVLATSLTILIIILNRLVVNKSLVKEIKDKMEVIRENLTKAQKEGNTENVNKFLNDMMKTNKEYMKITFKTIIISLIVISIFLPWMKYRYDGQVVAFLPFSLPFIGTSLDWILWYILVSFAIGWVIKKLFGVE